MIVAWPTFADPGAISKGRAASDGGAAFFVPVPRDSALLSAGVAESGERRDDRAGIQTISRKSKVRLMGSAKRFALGLSHG
jgi:hypothetical protein